MKEFDLELAKAGHPVCTRGGRKARIICFDANDKYYPIIALVEMNGVEEVARYTNKGKWLIDSDRDLNLIMALEKHEGWVNVYRDADTGLPYCGKFIYPSESDAVTHNDPTDASDKKVSIIKIEWKE